MSLIDDFRAECDELSEFVAALSEDDWRLPTAFFGWTTFDQILHLVWVDRLALASATDAARFATMRNAQAEAAVAGIEMSTLARREFGALPKIEVLEVWRGLYDELGAVLGALPLDHRVNWFGPDMSVASMLAARQMEIWAHGQDIYDLLRVSRQPAVRLKNICDLGVRTFGWTFANRQLLRPGPTPTVRLKAPDGSEWIWNEEAGGAINGNAEDFALVVTQRRNVVDTGLSCDGKVASEWMAMAQCFAGPPADPPVPGTRKF